MTPTDASRTAAGMEGWLDPVFRALADPTRRQLLDQLHASQGQTLRELCAGLAMARQSVTKHLRVLEEASLISTVRRGRERLHYLNAAPIHEITERWINKYDLRRVRALADLKRALEEPVSASDFVYITYIRTDPPMLWRALTDPAFTLRYWGVAMRSDWTVGSPILMQFTPGEEFREVGHVVLEADPYRRLSYRWHVMLPYHAEALGWSEDTFAAAVNEPLSKVTFDLEPIEDMVRLTVTHDDFPAGSPIHAAIGDGWPRVLSDLKTLLERSDSFGHNAASDAAGADTPQAGSDA